MEYKVFIDKKAVKGYRNFPAKIKESFQLLVGDLEKKGPVLPNWKNYSKIGKNTYHCHLSYSWVACWRYEKGEIEINIYYAGSREKAPY